MDNTFVHIEDGNTYMTGCLPRVSKLGELEITPGKFLPVCGGKAHSDGAPPLIPREKLATTPDVRPYKWHDYNQGNNPSCALGSAANGLSLFAKIMGRFLAVLDFQKAWKELTGGRGGAAVDEVLQYLMTTGMPIVGSTDRVIVTEAWDCATVQGVYSGISAGCMCEYGHYVPGPHAECGARVIVRNGVITLDTLNDWGDDWGENGWHEVDEANLQEGIPKFGAFLIRECILRPADVNGLPDAKGAA